MPSRFISKQLSCPTGFFAPIIGLLMNRHNARMNCFAMQQLHLTPTDRVLEIGFGGGLNLANLIAGAAFVGGVDRSSAMVRRAKSRAPDEVITALERAGFSEIRIERPAPSTPWNVLLATC